MIHDERSIVEYCRIPSCVELEVPIQRKLLVKGEQAVVACRIQADRQRQGYLSRRDGDGRSPPANTVVAQHILIIRDVCKLQVAEHMRRDVFLRHDSRRHETPALPLPNLAPHHGKTRSALQPR